MYIEGGPPRTDHSQGLLRRLPGGGFEIESAGQPVIRVGPSGSGWLVDGDEDMQGWRLRRGGGAGEDGFVLQTSDGPGEVARTMPLVGSESEGGLRFLLLKDGRLFRIVPSGSRDGGFDLLGWEMPGAYLSARPAKKDWKLVPTVAGGGLPDLRTISILFGAEILDSEEALRAEKP